MMSCLACQRVSPSGVGTGAGQRSIALRFIAMSISMYWLVVVILTCPSQDFDDVEFDSGLKQVHGRRVPEGMGADWLGGEGWLAGGCHCEVALEDGSHAEAGDPLAVGVEEQRGIRLVLVIALAEVGAERVGGLRPEWTDPLLASFAEDPHVAGRLQAHVADVQPD